MDEIEEMTKRLQLSLTKRGRVMNFIGAITKIISSIIEQLFKALE